MLSRFLHFARPYRGRILVGFLLLLATNGLSLWIPWLLRDAIHAIEEGTTAMTLAGFAGAMAGVALVAALVRTGSRLAVLGTSRRVAYDVRNAFFAHLQRLGASFFDRHRTGDIMSRGINDLQLIRSFFGPGLMNLMNTTIVYTAVLILLFRLDVVLTLIALMLYPTLFVGVKLLSKRIYSRSKAVQEQLGVVSNRAQENLSGIQQVKIYAQEEREIAAFREQCDEFRRRNIAMAMIRGSMVSLIGVVSGVGTLVVLLVGGQHVIEGRISFGDFVAFNSYIGMLAWPTIALGWVINVFQRGVGAMERIDEILGHEPDVPPALAEPVATEGSAGAIEAGKVDGDIEIRDLSFAYGGNGDGGAAQLRHVTLTIPRGSRVALVGPVGSGKSTLVNLLARVYPVPPGRIFIGGTDINHIPVGRLRRSLGYVPQEPFLFSRSLRENITLGRPEASEDDVRRAVSLSALEGDLSLFPEGLDTVVGERGFTLSGGQRQRAALARAALTDPRILILDDSLSAVDADTERAILDELARLMEGRTSILISHRLSTLADMDRIVVMEDGEIVEQGTHDELVARDGLYAHLFQRQLLEERLETA